MVKHITKAKWYGIFKTYEANAIEWNYNTLKYSTITRFWNIINL